MDHVVAIFGKRVVREGIISWLKNSILNTCKMRGDRGSMRVVLFQASNSRNPLPDIIFKKKSGLVRRVQETLAILVMYRHKIFHKTANRGTTCIP